MIPGYYHHKQIGSPANVYTAHSEVPPAIPFECRKLWNIFDPLIWNSSSGIGKDGMNVSYYFILIKSWIMNALAAQTLHQFVSRSLAWTKSYGTSHTIAPQYCRCTGRIPNSDIFSPFLPRFFCHLHVFWNKFYADT